MPSVTKASFLAKSMAADFDAAQAKLMAKLKAQDEAFNRSSERFSERAIELFQAKEDRHSFGFDHQCGNEDERFVAATSVSAGELVPTSSQMSQRMREQVGSWLAAANERATPVNESAKAASDRVASKLKHSLGYVESALFSKGDKPTGGQGRAMELDECAEERRVAAAEAAERRAEARPRSTMDDWRRERRAEAAAPVPRARADSDDVAAFEAELQAAITASLANAARGREDGEGTSSCTSSSFAPEPRKPDDEACASQSASTAPTDFADEIAEFFKLDEVACLDSPVERAERPLPTEPEHGTCPWHLKPSTATWLLAAP